MSRVRQVLIALVAAGGLLYVFVVRARIRRWGATDEEVRQPLPGQ